MASRSRRFTPALCQPDVARRDRRATGVYYTPPEIARLIVEPTLGPLLSGPTPRVLDPACGAGEFLLASHRLLADRFGKAAAAQSLSGVDIDPAAVEATRRRLRNIDGTFDATNVRIADALDRSTLSPGTFDAIIGNPPYVNIRQLSKSCSPEKIDGLRESYSLAQGNFDLYVLFIERAI